MDSGPAPGIREVLTAGTVELRDEGFPFGRLSGHDGECYCEQGHWNLRGHVCARPGQGRTRHWPGATVMATGLGRRAGGNDQAPVPPCRWTEYARGRSK